LLDLLRAFEIFIFDAAIKRALVALGFAAAQMGFADMRSHQFAARGHFEPLGGCLVGFNLWHAISPFSILDFRFFDSGRGGVFRGWESASASRFDCRQKSKISNSQ
jgi:hypothetical protein